ncbi:dihydroxyacetone kinase subunit DhaL [soil metagenome]
MASTSTARLIAMLTAIATAIEADKGRLCELDGIIGDADHGIAMSNGFNAVRDAVAALDPVATDPTLLLNTAAKSFLNAVGASSGPLYATALMRAAAAVKGKTELSDQDLSAIVQAMAKGIQDRGKAEIGEKTMIDAWAPAAKALADNDAAGGTLEAGLDAAVKAAQAGAEATKQMIAKKGRSVNLGERSIGNMDPGAASAVVIIETLRASLTA